MKIIKEGINPARTYRFKCTNCGCIYEETEDKCLLLSHYSDERYTVQCQCPMPFCNHDNYSTGIDDN